MKPSEIVGKMAAGVEYLKREDITPEQRIAAERKLDMYHTMLRESDETAAVVEVKPAIAAEPESDPTERWRNDIRKLLNIPRDDRKAR